VDGYLVAPGDHLDLARRMFSLLSDPPRSRLMGAMARRKAIGYSWTAAARRTARLCAELQYAGEEWSRSVDARSAIEMLHETLDGKHRQMLARATGVGADS
jgi:hypothetical protein